MRRFALAAALLVPLHLQGQDTTAVRLYREAVATAEQGRIPEAIRLMESAAERAPDAPNVYWNLGLWYAQLEQPARALGAWQKYRTLDPEDWHLRAKLIQTYQALGDTVRRDEERAALLRLRQAGTDTALARQTSYCREQFRVGDRKVMVFEAFEPAGDRRVFYAFNVFKPDGQQLGRYSLGSYETTTQIARELGEIRKDQRLYHLDWYAERVHATFRFYRTMPSYERVRADVVAALRGELQPQSSTRGR